MWDWRKLFLSTATPQKPSALETAFLSQSKAIERLMAKQQDLITQQQATLDRIVTAKYDRPIGLTPQPVASDSMPEWGMNDQGDVRPDDFQGVMQAISLESDEDFLKAVGAQ